MVTCIFRGACTLLLDKGRSGEWRTDKLDSSMALLHGTCPREGEEGQRGGGCIIGWLPKSFHRHSQFPPYPFPIHLKYRSFQFLGDE
jgi:hypothetical protein